MTTPQLLILDLDGTLVDSFPDIRHGIALALAAIGVEPTDALMELVRRGVGLEVFYERAVGRGALELDQLDRFELFVGTYRTTYGSSPHATRAFDGVADTLATLRSRHPDLRIAVATAKRTAMAEAVVDEVGLRGLVHAVCGSDDLPHKPDPAVLRRAAAAVGLPLAGAYMVGDTDKDVGAAHAAGCTACAVTYGGWTRPELEALGDAGPHHLLDRFADLLVLL